MSKKIFKKIACSALAAVSVFGCAASFTACKTSNPEVKMQIEFNGETYTLKYKLYRKIAPKTVEHFMWLADNGYYDGLCIHDYDAKALKMYTGAFSATADKEDGLQYKNYYETVRELALTDEFPHSVWNDKGKTDPTYTLYGEFWGDSEEGNRFKVENGNLKQTFGSLTMFYEDISSYDVSLNSVWIERASDDKMDSKVYKYNSATSQFFISLSTGQTSSNMYCTFATLKNDSVLEEFQEDLAEYIENNYDEDESFTTSRTVTVNRDDAFVGDYGIQKTYDVPKEPIIIKYVKVSKY